MAQAFRTRWDELKDAGAGYPASLAEEGSTPAKISVGSIPVTAWNAPMLGLVDLADATQRINAAKEGVRFLMFNPGPKNTLLNAILALDPSKLFIHGVFAAPAVPVDQWVLSPDSSGGITLPVLF